MVDDKDLEIARLRGRLEEREVATKTKRGDGLQAFAAIAFVGVLALLALAWNHGKSLDERDQAIATACRAVTEGEIENEACIRRMDEDYRGALDAEHTVNAAAEQVRGMRDGPR